MLDPLFHKCLPLLTAAALGGATAIRFFGWNRRRCGSVTTPATTRGRRGWSRSPRCGLAGPGTADTPCCAASLLGEACQKRVRAYPDRGHEHDRTDQGLDPRSAGRGRTAATTPKGPIRPTFPARAVRAARGRWRSDVFYVFHRLLPYRKFEGSCRSLPDPGCLPISASRSP